MSRAVGPAWIAVASGAIAIGAAGCIDVLGLDPPLREICPAGACADASSSYAPPPNPVTAPHHDGGASGGTGAPPPSPTPPIVDAGTIDATPDAGPTTFRCGGPGNRLSYCLQSTQTCCAYYADQGTYDFRCIAQTGTCDGVPISCAKQTDCPASTVCCATDTLQSCVSRGTCTGVLVCDPAANECPAGTTCNAFPNPVVPYYGCQ